MEKLSNVDIFKWLQSKKYQTEQGEQEYKMYFDVDMPKIIRAAIEELTPQPPVRSAEEILVKKFNSTDPFLAKKQIIECMQEYADQFK